MINGEISLEELRILISKESFTADEHKTLLELRDYVKYIILNVQPYMTAVDAMVHDTENGEVTVKLTVRTGVVEKMEFIQSKRWLNPTRQAPPIPKP